MDTTVSSRPTVAIFLDIHGVFTEHHRLNKSFDSRLAAKFTELFGKKTIQNDTPKNRSIVDSHFFCKEALEHFDALVQRINEVATPYIVISSYWRHHLSIQDFQKEIFGAYKFAQYIADKTPFDGEVTIFPEEAPNIEVDLSDISLLRQEAMQINSWLAERASSLKIENFVVINDCDYGFSTLFNEHVVYVNESFFSKAYADESYAILEKKPSNPLYIRPSAAKARLQSA